MKTLCFHFEPAFDMFNGQQQNRRCTACGQPLTAEQLQEATDRLVKLHKAKTQLKTAGNTEAASMLDRSRELLKLIARKNLALQQFKDLQAEVDKHNAELQPLFEKYEVSEDIMLALNDGDTTPLALMLTESTQAKALPAKE